MYILRIVKSHRTPALALAPKSDEEGNRPPSLLASIQLHAFGKYQVQKRWWAISLFFRFRGQGQGWGPVALYYT